MTTSPPILVTGATGRQGGATARALLAAGQPVRALVRDRTTGAAEALETAGAELVVGDLMDPASLDDATQGVRAVFSVQMPPATPQGVSFDDEVTQGLNLIEAAHRAGARQFVHSSVSGVGQHRDAPGWSEGRWAPMEPYFAAKQTIQDQVRTRGFSSWTILKPAYFMENLNPSLRFLLPHGKDGGLVTILHPETELALVATEDIGAAAAAAFQSPERFHEVELELASDRLTLRQVAEVLTRRLGVSVTAPRMTAEQALAAGMPPMGLGHEWMNVVGQPARPDDARRLGLRPTSFEEWAQTHVDR